MSNRKLKKALSDSRIVHYIDTWGMKRRRIEVPNTRSGKMAERLLKTFIRYNTIKCRRCDERFHRSETDEHLICPLCEKMNKF